MRNKRIRSINISHHNGRKHCTVKVNRQRYDRVAGWVEDEPKEYYNPTPWSIVRLDELALDFSTYVTIWPNGLTVRIWNYRMKKIAA